MKSNLILLNNNFQNKFKIVKRGKDKTETLPNTTEDLHEAWFFNLKPKYYVQMCKEWNEHNLKIELPNITDYDDWLNYFKTLSPNKIKLLAITGQDIISTEAYAALSRWHDIISNPHRIEKIHQSGLTNGKRAKEAKSVLELAQSNDRLGVLKAVRDRIAEKLEKGAGARDTAALSREMTEIMTQIAEYEKRMGPKKSTMLGKLMGDMPTSSKRPAKNGNGARNTSFKSRVTIHDVESM